MQTDSVKLYSLRYGEAKTYIAAALFVVGNMVLPQLCHMVPNGGRMLLPIYFFTLVAAYKYGWRAGLLTAVASPVVNSLLFGMPPAAALPAILLKSVLLAVLGYQLIGTLGEWAIVGNLYAAAQDFRIGVPGMVLQAVGGWAVINWLIRR